MVLPDSIKAREDRKFTDVNGQVAVNVFSLAGLGIGSYDTTELSYTGDDLTQVVYKLDSSIIATLTLTYSSGQLTKVVKT